MNTKEKLDILQNLADREGLPFSVSAGSDLARIALGADIAESIGGNLLARAIVLTRGLFAVMQERAFQKYNNEKYERKVVDFALRTIAGCAIRVTCSERFSGLDAYEAADVLIADFAKWPGCPGDVRKALTKAEQADFKAMQQASGGRVVVCTIPDPAVVAEVNDTIAEEADRGGIM